MKKNMTQEEEKRANDLIADFMGWKLICIEDECCSNYQYHRYENGEVVEKYDGVGPESYINYHHNWNELMEVVEKIENLDESENHYQWQEEDGTIQYNFSGFEFDIRKKSCTIWENCQLDPAEMVGGDWHKEYDTKIEAVWQAVLDFVVFYKERYPNLSLNESYEYYCKNQYPTDPSEKAIAAVTFDTEPMSIEMFEEKLIYNDEFHKLWHKGCTRPLSHTERMTIYAKEHMQPHETMSMEQVMEFDLRPFNIPKRKIK